MRDLAAVFFGFAAGILCGCGTGPIQAVGYAPDVVAHWRFDDRSGTALVDSTSNHHDGTIVGATWSWTAGRIAGALHLEQGDYVSVDNFPDAKSDFTVAAWVQVPIQVASAGDWTLISTENAFKGGWQLQVTSSKYHFGFWTGPAPTDYSYAECSSCIRPDQWQHLAAVVDGEAMTVALYLDGEQQTPISIPKRISPGVLTLYMGRWATTNTPRPLIGSLDDIAIWNRALSAAEIGQLVESPAP